MTLLNLAYDHGSLAFFIFIFSSGKINHFGIPLLSESEYMYKLHV